MKHYALIRMNKLNIWARILALFLGLSFLLLLGASLYKRFTQPHLTINRASAVAEEGMPGDMGVMNEIGRLMQAVSKNPQDKEAILTLVESLMAMGQWQSAENFAQKALSLEGESDRDPRPLYLLALVHHNQGKHEQAAELLEKLLEKTETAPARYSLGILYLHYLNKPKAGIEHLQKGLADPKASQSLKAAIQEELEKAAGFEEGNMGKNREPANRDEGNSQEIATPTADQSM